MRKAGRRFWAKSLQENEGDELLDERPQLDLKNRGVQDILIACMDGLTGFPDAVRSVFPETKVQLCIVHMVRSSTRYVSWKDRKAVCLRPSRRLLRPQRG